MTSRTFGLGMAAVAFLVGRAIHINDGYYSGSALLLITAAIGVCAAVTLLPPIDLLESLPAAVPIALVASAVAAESVMLVRTTPVARWGLALVGILGVLQALRLGRLRVPLLACTLAVFSIVASVVFWRVAKAPTIDVFMFQQMASAGLLHGENPYTPRYPNLYGPNPPFYGPGVVDATNHLTVGLPYPPLSLLVTLPAYVAGGDVRYADVAAIALAALLIAIFQRSRWTGLIAMLFLLTPRVLFVIEQSWTEAVFVLAFAFVMMCALRWKPALPWALGLFFATKQYAVLTLPFISFLAPEDDWPSLFKLVGKAATIAAAITLPFFFWDPHAFWRSIVEFQFIQPMRMDALSYLALAKTKLPDSPLLMWAAFIALVPTVALALWRCPRTPASFAGAATLVGLVFFALNKQAFCNYYYFVIGTACCAAAAANAPAGPAEAGVRASGEGWAPPPTGTSAMR